MNRTSFVRGYSSETSQNGTKNVKTSN